MSRKTWKMANIVMIVLGLLTATLYAINHIRWLHAWMLLVLCGLSVVALFIDALIQED